jgi:hypothetical protein
MKIVNLTKNPYTFRHLTDADGKELPEVRLGIEADRGIVAQPQPEVTITKPQYDALKQRPVFTQLVERNELVVK